VQPTQSQADAAATPREVVEAFLAALEARDLPAAARHLAPGGAAMTFPGGQSFADLESLVAWSKDRYRAVRKTYERIEELAVDARGITVVYCRGTLAGEWPDGRAFAGIRFIDRFEIDDAGRIVDQQVWNDLGESLRGAGSPG
jgi:limonene-1,2-epoxide hydrolase